MLRQQSRLLAVISISGATNGSFNWTSIVKLALETSGTAAKARENDETNEAAD
jgi:hypothetical protein